MHNYKHSWINFRSSNSRLLWLVSSQRELQSGFQSTTTTWRMTSHRLLKQCSSQSTLQEQTFSHSAEHTIFNPTMWFMPSISTVNHLLRLNPALSCLKTLGTGVKTRTALCKSLFLTEFRPIPFWPSKVQPCTNSFLVLVRRTWLLQSFLVLRTRRTTQQPRKCCNYTT